MIRRIGFELQSDHYCVAARSLDGGKVHPREVQIAVDIDRVSPDFIFIAGDDHDCVITRSKIAEGKGTAAVGDHRQFAGAQALQLYLDVAFGPAARRKKHITANDMTAISAAGRSAAALAKNGNETDNYQDKRDPNDASIYGTAFGMRLMKRKH